MESEIANKERLLELDVLKTIAILMVISLHMGLWNYDFYNDGNVILSKWIQFFFRLVAEGVPIFLCVNGYLLLKKPFEWGKHKRRLISIFFYFTLWTFIQVLNLCLRNGDFTFEKFVGHIISGDYSGTLWFYKTLLFIYLLVPVMSLAFYKNKKIYYFGFYTLLLFTVVPRFFASFDVFLTSCGMESFTGMTRFLTDFYPLENRGSASILFFTMGGVLLDKKDIIYKKAYFWIVLGVSSWIIQAIWYTYLTGIRQTTHAAFWFGNISEVLFCVSMFAGSILLKNMNLLRSFFLYVGNNTNGIYVIHSILISRISDPFIGSFLGRLGYLLGIFLLSLTITWIINCIPCLRRTIKL